MTNRRAQVQRSHLTIHLRQLGLFEEREAPAKPQRAHNQYQQEENQQSPQRDQNILPHS